MCTCTFTSPPPHTHTYAAGEEVEKGQLQAPEDGKGHKQPSEAKRTGTMLSQPTSKLSKFLYVPPAPGCKKTTVQNSGARVLTSIEHITILEEKERKKQEEVERKEQRKKERMERKAQKDMEARRKAQERAAKAEIKEQRKRERMEKKSTKGCGGQKKSPGACSIKKLVECMYMFVFVNGGEPATCSSCH